MQPDSIGEFLAETVGYLKSKIHTTIEDNTWFHGGTAETMKSASINTKYLELLLRIRRYNNEIFTYYKLSGSDTWINTEEPMSIPQALHDVPIQFGSIHV